MVKRMLLSLALTMILCVAHSAHGKDMEMNQTGGDSYFGINGVSAFHQRQALGDEIPRRLKILQDLDIRWERGDFWWHVVEPEEGQFDWSFPDAMLEVFEAHDIQYFPILNYGSAWARGDGYAPANELEWREFGNYVYETLNRYKDRMKYWEVWNEPNILPFWRPVPDAEDYTEMLKVAYRQAKRADPDCVIVAPCSAGFDRNFVERMYQAGGKDYFDIFSWHYYSIAAPEEGIKREIQDIRNMMSKYGDRDKDIWITEMGVTSHPDQKMGVPEDEQARLLVRHYLTNLAAGVKRVFWFTLIDWTSDPDDERWDAFLGLQRTNRTDKPSYHAMKTLVKVIDGAEYVGDPQLNGNVHTWLWKNGDEYILVAYSKDEQQQQLSIPVLDGNIKKIDMDGTETVVQASDPLLIDMTPTYFIGVDKSLGLRASFGFEPDSVRALSEKKQQVELVWTNPLEERVKAEIQVDAPEGWKLKPSRKTLTLPPGETARLPIFFHAPPVATGEEINITAKGRLADASEDAQPVEASLRVCVDQAANIRIRPLIVGDKLHTHVSVGNNLSEPEKGKLSLNFPWKTEVEPLSLHIGQRAETSFDHEARRLRELEQTQYIQANLELGWGWSQAKKEFGIAVIPKCEKIFNNKPDTPPVVHLSEKHRVANTDAGEDFFADLWFHFSEDRFHFYGEFHDTTPAANPFEDEDIWKGDCIEFYLGFDGPEEAPYYSSKDYQVIASPGQKGEEAHIFYWPVMERIEDAKVEVKLTDYGYIFKGSIPLSIFEGVEIEEDSVIGFDVSIHDYSLKQETLRSLMWNGTGANWQTPRDWGMAVIKPRNPDK